MKSFSKYLKWITSFITIAVGILTVYFYLHKERVSLEIKTMSAQLLTAPTSTDDLRVQYYYKDTIQVRNLWQVQYVIRNVGDATLVGIGEDRQLLESGLPFTFSEDSQILSCAITQSNNEATLGNNRIYFKQWKPKEFIEITAFIENTSSPQISISDRDIKDSEIVYTAYTPEIQDNSQIIDSLPKSLKTTLKIIYYILAFILMIGVIVALCQQGSLTDKIGLLIVFIFLLIPLLWMI